MRTIPINLIDDERTQAFSAGQQGENNAVELAITLPTEVRGLAHRLVFDNTISPTLIEVGGEVRYSLPSTVTSFEDNHFTLESYQGGVRIYKSPKITLFFDEAIGVEEPPKDDPIRAEVAENTKARHTHANKPTLDKFSEQDGTPLFDGRPIGSEGGTSDHNLLLNRDKANQHPMSAITGLPEALENKQPKGDYATKSELADKADKADIPTKTSQLQNDSEFATKTDVSNASTLVVTITANPLDRQSYVADVGAREILNAVGQGRTVEAHFEDTVEKSGDQIYEYLKFKDNSAYFRRFYLMPDKVTVRQIDIEIKLNKEVVFTDSKAEFATADEAQNLTHDKLDVKYERIDGKEVSQLEARAILENPTEYEDKFIIFMANKVSPTKAVATGFIVNDGEGNTYLSVTDNEGHFKRFNKDTFETFEIIAKDRTKETLALDDLTIDVQGQAGFINSVHNAFNRPEGTSTDGIIKVVAYNIENQLQEYTDVKNGYKYIRLVTGTANQHSFGMWQRVDITIENAKVGEAVFVKAVDSNNHPTEYETKAVGGGGNLPTPTPEDNGKVPTVEGEKYVLKTPTGGSNWKFLAELTAKNSVASLEYQFPKPVPIEKIKALRIDVIDDKGESSGEGWGTVGIRSRPGETQVFNNKVFKKGEKFSITIEVYDNRTYKAKYANSVNTGGTSTCIETLTLYNNGLFEINSFKISAYTYRGDTINDGTVARFYVMEV